MLKLPKLLRKFLTLGVTIATLPEDILNGEIIDAVPVMANFDWIVAQVNANVGVTLKMVPMSTTARDALTPSEGWVIMNSTTHKLNFYNGSAWEVVTSA